MTRDEAITLLVNFPTMTSQEKMEVVHDYMEIELNDAQYRVKTDWRKRAEVEAWAGRKFGMLLKEDSDTYVFRIKAEADLMREHWGIDE